MPTPETRPTSSLDVTATTTTESAMPSRTTTIVQPISSNSAAERPMHPDDHAAASQALPTSSDAAAGAAPPAPATLPPASAARLRTRPYPLWNLLDFAKAELNWIHQEDDGGAAYRGPRRTIQRWIARLPSWHRGVIALWYDTRDLSPALLSKLAVSVALVARVYGTCHPVIATREGAERQAVAAMEELLQARRFKKLGAYEDRADELFRHALVAYAKLRDNVGPVAPGSVAPDDDGDEDLDRDDDGDAVDDRDLMAVPDDDELGIAPRPATPDTNA